MVPFLMETYETLVCSFCARSVRKEVLLGANIVTKLVKVDIDNQKNLVLLHKVDLGFGIKYELTKLKNA